MEQTGYWVGLDCGIETTAVCVIDQDGVIHGEESCATDAYAVQEILQSYPRWAIKQLSVEAGVATHMIRQLREMNLPVRVCEVRKASKFLTVRRHKTDANDAKGLAELGRVGTTIGSEVYVKPLECQNIRTQLVARKNLIEQRVKIETMIQSFVRLHGGTLKLRYARGSLSEDIASQLERLGDDGIDTEADIAPLVRIAEAIRSHLRDVDRRMKVAAQCHPICALLLTVPGVGPITALSFYSAISDPWRFSRNRDVGPYLGLTPKLFQSGTRSRMGGISKHGSTLTRTHLVSAATVLLTNAQTECDLRTWGQSLARRVGLAKARVAVARKLAVLLLHLWKANAQFRAGHVS